VGGFIRIGPCIEEGEPSSCGGAPRGVVLGGHKILSPLCVLRSQNLPLKQITARLGAIHATFRARQFEHIKNPDGHRPKSSWYISEMVRLRSNKNFPMPSRWVQTTRLAIGYNVCSKSCLVLNF
jgi:hypothetical protein